MVKNQTNESKINKLFNKNYHNPQFLPIMYVFVILAIFPLVYHNFYFDIMNFKYKFYYITTIIFLALSLIFRLINNEWQNGNLIKSKTKLKKYEFSMIAFLLIAILSTIQSDFKYEAFWGNEGRYTGCFLLLLYGISFLIVSKTLNFKKWILNVFLITGFLVCLFGITDFFQLDILKFKVNMDPSQYNIFVSTIGNINSYTSYVAMIVAASTVLFTSEKILWKTILYFICMVVSFFSILMGLSDNSYLALGALFGFLPLYLFKTKTGLKRYLLMLTSFSGVIYGIDIIYKFMPDKVLERDGILQKLSGYGYLEYVVLAMVVLSLLVYVIDYFTKTKDVELGNKWQYIWLLFILGTIALVIFILIDVNLFKHGERYGEFSSYLLFNDDWGTHRGYNWRIGLENYNRFSLTHKLFGFGPDTYGILTHYNNFGEMVNKYGEVYDSAHNEYLQYFITMGPFSLISYLALLISSGIRMVRQSKGDAYIMAILFSVICYAVQATVNISVPIVAPIMFTLLAIGLAGVRDTTKTIEEL